MGSAASPGFGPAAAQPSLQLGSAQGAWGWSLKGVFSWASPLVRPKITRHTPPRSSSPRLSTAPLGLITHLSPCPRTRSRGADLLEGGRKDGKKWTKSCQKWVAKSMISRLPLQVSSGGARRNA